jgi:hypothetical protein
VFVTITITNNQQYCRDHGLVITRRSHCQCSWPGGENPDSQCQVCQGTGWDGQPDYLEYPPDFAISVVITNFATLWSALGLEATPSGMISPQQLLAILQTWDPELSVRSPAWVTEPSGECWLSCGLPMETVLNYQKRLTFLCQEAVKRGENVVVCSDSI